MSERVTFIENLLIERTDLPDEVYTGLCFIRKGELIDSFTIEEMREWLNREPDMLEAWSKWATLSEDMGGRNLVIALQMKEVMP